VTRLVRIPSLFLTTWVVVCGCTTDDTGSIDLLSTGSAAPKPPKGDKPPPMPPMGSPDATACQSDLDCQAEADARRSRCDVPMGVCVPCKKDDPACAPDAAPPAPPPPAPVP
jgi:hypothetical protein